jgi:FKBP-type peptidyl-prolyl cis-trans isomerase
MMRIAALALAFVALFAVPAVAAGSPLSREANAEFLAANAKKPGVNVTPSGLQYRIIQNGFGTRPSANDTVTVYYKGSLINGTMFDGTEPGMPANFVVNKLVPGWTEALELMREGDHWEIVVPANLGYGDRGAGGGVIPPDQTLVFDLELMKVTVPPPKQKGDDDDQQ